MVMTKSHLVAAFIASHFPRATGVQLNINHEARFDQFGKSTCPCVGLSGFVGTTPVTIDGQLLPERYDREIGSSCRDWDRGKFPKSCRGKDSLDEDWCFQPWCYVDVNNCDEEKGPFPSRYFDNAFIRGKTLHYSYATCGGKNTFSRRYRTKTELASERSTAALTASTYGSTGCECVAIEGLSGTTAVTVDGSSYPDRYSSDTGSSCQAWDKNRYPKECDGSKPQNADWCSQAWCWVDPDKCTNVAKGPFETQYMKHLKFHGKAPHYSYETCGGTNTFNL